MARWVLDPDHSVAVFAVKHFTITEVRGQFNKLSGEVIFDADAQLVSAFDLEIAVASLFTGVPKRDAHLLSPDFFDAARFPVMRFRSAAAEPTSWNTFRVRGNVAIREVEREILLQGTFAGPVQGPQDLGGEICMGFALSGRLATRDFGFAWNHPMEKRGMVVGPEVRLWVNLETDLA